MFLWISSILASPIVLSVFTQNYPINFLAYHLDTRLAGVGWIDAVAKTHHLSYHPLMGFAVLYPSYAGLTSLFLAAVRSILSVDSSA
jgi:squalene cyclase